MSEWGIEQHSTFGNAGGCFVEGLSFVGHGVINWGKIAAKHWLKKMLKQMGTNIVFVAQGNQIKDSVFAETKQIKR